MFDILITRTPKFYYGRPGSALFHERFLPLGIGNYPQRKPCKIEHLKRHYITGQFTRGLVFTEFEGLHAIGLNAPPQAVVVAASGGSITAGVYIGYMELRHKVGTTVVHRSNLGTGSDSFTLDGTEQRTWTIPATFTDARATHVGLLVSRDGSLPGEVAEVTVGTTTLTEDNDVLGYIPPVDSDGNLKQARGVPPYARYLVKYHKRGWYGGDPNFPARWWYSEIDEIESVGSLNYVDMLDGETVTGGGSASDTLLVTGQTSADAIQGWEEADFRISRVSPDVGCISHWSIVNISGVLWLATEMGVYTYIPGAGFRPMMFDDFLTEWREEYAANERVYEQCTAGDDRESRVYKLLLSFTSLPRSRYWVGSYAHYASEGTADWMFDRRNRVDSAMGMLRAAGSKRSAFFTGSCDGHLRRENVQSNSDDDGDTLGKPFIFETPHFLPGSQQGDDNQAFAFNDVTIYLKSEERPWTIEGRGGDDQAYLATRADWQPPTQPASQDLRGNRRRTPKTSHHFHPTTLSGKGAIFKVTIPRALDARYRGLALGWTDGHQNRGLIDEP